MKLKMYVGIVWPKLVQNIYVFDTLMVKEIETDYVPAIGDRVELYSVDGDEGPHWFVKGRYMNADGTWCIELDRIVMNPILHVRDKVTSVHGCAPWYTEADGEPEALLRAGGWRVHGE